MRVAPERVDPVRPVLDRVLELPPRSLPVVRLRKPRPATTPKPAPHRRWVPWTVALVAYMLLAALAFWPVQPLSHTEILGCACSDPLQEAWFLAWPASAIRHGASPFFTTALSYPHGVNLADNTSMPLLGLLGAPVTWLFGPVATFNLLMRLSFALSATSMLYVLRRLRTWWPAAFAGGLLYGFSPYMVGQGNGHLFLTFVPLPPLIALCVYELGTGQRRDAAKARPRTQGIALGILCTLQFFISIEVLVTTLISLAVVLAAAAIRRPRRALDRLHDMARGAGWAAAICAPLVAYPTWYFLEGRQHIVGPPHAVAAIAPFRADLLGPIVPTLNELLGPSHLMAIGSSYGAGDRPENGVYLGLVMLVLLGFLVVRCRDETIVRSAAALSLTGFVFALGSPLVIGNHATGVPLPFAVLQHVPLIQGVLAERFSLYEQMGAAVVLGVGLDRIRRHGWVRQGQTTGRTAWRSTALLAAVAGLALLPLVPRFPYASRPTTVPQYFQAAAVRSIPPGSMVLTYPYDVDPDNDAMLWQAVSGMRFRILGGQVSTPGAGRRATSDVADLSPPEMQQLFQAARWGSTGPRGASSLPLDGSTFRELRRFLVRNDVGTVVVDPIGRDPALVVADLTEALGRQPTVTGGVDVWYAADRRAAKLLDAPAPNP